ncbi:MAG: GTPase ObgE [Patescibacteria group bacterium]|nr:GTPase ObgE [Patescibacteria group bacterium]
MLIDNIQIHVRGGHGGRGAVAFDKNKFASGPTGASGADGGGVYLEGVSDIGALRQFRHKKDYFAPDGQHGRGQFRDGARGEDLVFKVPVGTVSHNLETGFDSEIVKIGERLLVAKGGRGGKGNFHFRSPRNTTPQEFQPGLPGDDFELLLELKLIADVGFIGLPNIGKSTLLNTLTEAKSKVANYQFTTLEPHLGAYGDLILADIPGLIEGASGGKGLGHKFLRHVERTRTLFHFIDAGSEDPVGDYQTIRKELENYNPALLDKPERIIISRTDNVSEKDLKTVVTALKKLNKQVTPVSILDDKSIEGIRKVLNKLEKEKGIK